MLEQSRIIIPGVKRTCKSSRLYNHTGMTKTLLPYLLSGKQVEFQCESLTCILFHFMIDKLNDCYYTFLVLKCRKFSWLRCGSCKSGDLLSQSPCIIIWLMRIQFSSVSSRGMFWATWTASKQTGNHGYMNVPSR